LRFMQALQTAPPIQSAASTATPLVLQPLWQSALAPRLLTAGKYQIGAAADCEIQVPNSGVADRHAVIVAGPQKIVLRAWDSRTWVNDAVVREVTLRPGDRVAIGPVVFRIRRATPDDLLGQLPAAETITSSATPAIPSAPPRVQPSSKPIDQPAAPVCFDTTESVACSSTIPSGEWFSGVATGPVFEAVIEPPHWISPAAPVETPTPAEPEPQIDMEALVAAHLREHQAAMQAERAAWEAERSEWEAHRTRENRDYAARVEELSRRNRELDQRAEVL